MAKNKLYSKKKSKIKISYLVISIILIIALVSGGIIIWRNKANSRINYNFDVKFHGEKVDNMHYEGTNVPERIEDKFFNNFINDNLAINKKKIEWIRGETFIDDGEEINFEDQLNLLAYYVRQNNSKDYEALYTSILNYFGIKEQDISTQIKFAGVLIEGYVEFSENKYLEMAIEISEYTYPLSKEHKIVPSQTKLMLPLPTPTPNFSATPTPKPSITPTIEPENLKYINVVDLSKIDLYAIYLLSEIEPGWMEIFTNTKDIMINAKVQGANPFYRPAYNIETKNYIAYMGESMVYDMHEQMRIIYSLARAGEINADVISYLNGKLHNTKTLYRTYQILTSDPGIASESIVSYAYVAIISRMLEDETTYKLAVDRIIWNIATSTTSPIYGLPFNSFGEDCVEVVSNDIILSLIAMK